MAAVAGQIHEISAVVVLQHMGGQLLQLGPVDVTEPVGDFFNTGDLQALAFLNGLDVCGRLLQGFMGSG